jgi:hypothetical protein
MKRRCTCGGTIRKLSSPKPGAVQVGSRLTTHIVLTHQCERCDCQYGTPAPPAKENTPDGNQ